jgi:ABC-2 type transport system permease protein
VGASASCRRRRRASASPRCVPAISRACCRAARITADSLRRLLAPSVVAVRFLDPERGRQTRAEKIAAGVLMGVMFMTIFTSLAYILTGISGEKQLRVTESIIAMAMIPAQAWIDGKVLGISAFALVTTLSLAVSGSFIALAAYIATSFTIPAAAIRPGTLLALVAFMTMGLLLWNSFFAAVAATVDDPNTSSRTPLMFLPMLPIALSVVVLGDPDSTLARVLSLLPITSAPAMPMRIALSDPGLPEIIASAALLAAGIWLMRRVAGRIFEIGMLMYGKEPSLAEVMRWARSRAAAPVADSP